MGTLKNNRTSKVFAADEKTEIRDLINRVSMCLDIGISLTDKERSSLPSVAKERMPYIRSALKAATHYPEVLSRSFNEEEFKKDVELTEFMHDVLLLLSDLTKKAEDIFLLAGSESFKSAGVVRDFLKASHKDNPAYNAVMMEMDAFFKRTNKEEKPEVPVDDVREVEL
ncbi:MAG: hypothetical protein CSB06_00665 [Bacteroidia bacterium]|nr:MAG: hypothetical protein CSB06_00665 [Bacteroidia bacterium]